LGRARVNGNPTRKGGDGQAKICSRAHFNSQKLFDDARKFRIFEVAVSQTAVGSVPRGHQDRPEDKGPHTNAATAWCKQKEVGTVLRMLGAKPVGHKGKSSKQQSEAATLLSKNRFNALTVDAPEVLFKQTPVSTARSTCAEAAAFASSHASMHPCTVRSTKDILRLTHKKPVEIVHFFHTAVSSSP
jgi:hypothetical protein